MRRFTQVMLPVAAALAVLAGTGALVGDPTESAFAVRLRNDTAHTVVFAQCADTCSSHFHEVDTVAPGGSVPVNTSSSDIDEWWAVLSGHRRVGCLNLRSTARVRGLTFRASGVRRCPGSLGGVLGPLLR